MKKRLLCIAYMGLMYSVHIYAQIPPPRDPNKALLEASKAGRHEHLAELVRIYGANINTTDENGWTSLMWAAWNDNAATVRSLLKFEPTLDATDKNGNTALILAIDPRPTERITKHTYDIIKVLLEYGANPLLQNNQKQTALDLLVIKETQDELAQRAQRLLERYISNFPL